MVADAQEDSPEEAKWLRATDEIISLDTFDKFARHAEEQAAKRQAEDKVTHDTGFDLGWEAGQNAIRDGMIVQVQEAHQQGFQKGFRVGFKEGFQVGDSEAKPLPVTVRLPESKVDSYEGCTCHFCESHR